MANEGIDPDELLRQLEGDLVGNRLEELREQPIDGNFDLNHLKAIHAYIFQDLPEHQPGIVRGDTDDWIKTRWLEGQTSGGYVVHYESQDIDGKIANILRDFGGPESIKGLSTEEAANRIAELYGDLDHAHGFYEGNSRTLREFTRELANEADFDLDWTPTNISAAERNELYLARDLEVLQRAFPDLPQSAMQTNDRAEYEASFVIEGIQQKIGDRPLAALIEERLSDERALERDPAPSLEDDVKQAEESARQAASGRRDYISRDAVEREADPERSPVENDESLEIDNSEQPSYERGGLHDDGGHEHER